MKCMHCASLVGLVIVMTLVPAVKAPAQDTHYWHDQYGTQGMLLSGAIIGTVSDMSATYYNPGGLGYIAEPSVLISTNAYQITNVTVEDGAGEGFNLESSSLNILPNLVAGAFRFAWLGKHKLAYSLLTRNRFDVEVRGARVSRRESLPGFQGEVDFAGGLNLGGKRNELWIGLTWALGMSDKVGIGITQYLSYHDQAGHNELFAQAQDATGPVALIYDIDNYSAQVYSLLWKAGLGVNLQPFTLGLTLTTPNVRLLGSGNATYNSTWVNVPDPPGDPINYFETDIQQDVPANYHYPLSIGFGAGLHLKRTKIHFSGEWFDGVNSYDALELQPFTSQDSGEQVMLAKTQALRSVVNFGVGLQHKFGDKTTGYLSFNTDHSAADPSSDVSVTEFDIYHASGGANFNFAKLEVMLGLRYAWGSQMTTQKIDLDPEEEVVNPGDQVNVKYSQITFLVGFTARI